MVTLPARYGICQKQEQYKSQNSQAEVADSMLGYFNENIIFHNDQQILKQKFPKFSLY